MLRSLWLALRSQLFAPLLASPPPPLPISKTIVVRRDDGAVYYRDYILGTKRLGLGLGYSLCRSGCSASRASFSDASGSDFDDLFRDSKGLRALVFDLLQSFRFDFNDGIGGFILNFAEFGCRVEGGGDRLRREYGLSSRSLLFRPL